MTEEAPGAQKPHASSGRLPALTAKRHAASPFRPLAAHATEPRELSDQVRADPAAASAASTAGSGDEAPGGPVREPGSKATDRSLRSAGPGRGKTKPKPEDDLVRLQTLVPFEIQIAFKMHCARSRTTINDELRRLIERFLAKRP